MFYCFSCFTIQKAVEDAVYKYHCLYQDREILDTKKQPFYFAYAKNIQVSTITLPSSLKLGPIAKKKGKKERKRAGGKERKKKGKCMQNKIKNLHRFSSRSQCSTTQTIICEGNKTAWLNQHQQFIWKKNHNYRVGKKFKIYYP